MAELNRLKTVRALLEQRITPYEAIAVLNQFPWDFEGRPVVIERKHISNILLSYLNGTISGSGVAAWAEAIELRDDIEPESGYGDRVLEVVFELANPTINFGLTPERATELLSLITSD